MRARPYRYAAGRLGGIRWLAVLASAAIAAAGAGGQTEPPQQQAPAKPQPPLGPLGVIPLPQGPPPTGPQAPLPPPAEPLPPGDHPLLVSPPLSAIRGYAQTRPITLQDAVAIALYTSRNLASAVASLQAAQARTGQARSAFNPTLGVNAQVTEYDQATKASLGQGAPSITLTPQFNPVVVTTFAVPIDIMGTLRAAVNQAQFAEVAARVEVNRVRNQIVFDTKAAFYNALRAQAGVAVATNTLNNALIRLDDANKYYAVGTAPRFDVITAQRDVADAQRALIDAQSLVSLSLAALKSTIGLDPRTPLRLSDAGAVDYPPGVPPPTVPPLSPAETGAAPTGGPPPGGAAPAQPAAAPNLARVELPPAGQVEDPLALGPEFDALRAEAVRTRPEVLEAEAQIAAARHGIRFARRSALPALSFSLGHIYMPEATSFTRPNQLEAVLGVSLPILDGGLARARVREAQANVSAAEEGRRQAVDQVQLDVQQAYINLIQARNRVAVANVGLAQAREAFRLAQVRYAAGVSQAPGVSPQLELSNAQTSLTAAQTNQVNALYDYNNARAQLDRAVGRYSYAPAGPGYASPSAIPKGTGK